MSGNRVVIIPSIASGNMLNVEEEIRFIDRNYGHIHIDIEDGNYIPNITFGEKLLKLICQNSSSQKSIHMMVNKPEAFLKTIKECKPDIVFLHTDVTRYPRELIRLYQDEGIRVGIAVNPGIGVSEIEYIIPLVEDVLVLTCEPDRRGQKYIKAMEDKIGKLYDYSVNIWVDGGIGEDQIEDLGRLGVGYIIMGRTVFGNRDRVIGM